MIFPNLEIIDKDDAVYFHNDGDEGVRRYFYIRNIYQPDETTAYLFLSQEFTNITNASNYIIKKGYTKLFIFIDDIFRDHLMFTNAQAEIKAVKEILEKTNIKDYRIFHCEMLNKGNYENPFDVDIEYYDMFLTHWIKKNPYDHELNINFENKISFYNNRDDYHRQYMAAMLINNNDIDLTLNQKHRYTYIANQSKFPINQFSKGFQRRLKSNLIQLDKVHRNYVDGNNSELKMIDNYKEQHDDKVVRWIENSFVNLVGETTYYLPYPYISEKSLKPMLAHRPFIMLGPHKSLEVLRELGFKTFDKWVDEDYDKEPDPHKRLEMVYELTQDVLRKDPDELKEMLLAMGGVLRHNKKVVDRLPHDIWESLL